MWKELGENLPVCFDFKSNASYVQGMMKDRFGSVRFKLTYFQKDLAGFLQASSGFPKL